MQCRRAGRVKAHCFDFAPPQAKRPAQIPNKPQTGSCRIQSRALTGSMPGLCWCSLHALAKDSGIRGERRLGLHIGRPSIMQCKVAETRMRHNNNPLRRLLDVMASGLR